MCTKEFQLQKCITRVEMAERSRRRLTYSETGGTQQEGTPPCVLCKTHHSQQSQPRTWKNTKAQELSASLGVDQGDWICRACRDDISRLLKDSSHPPRWEKGKPINCCVPSCSEAFFSHYKVGYTEQLISIMHTMGCSAVPTPIPLCKHHYHVIYDQLQPKQTHCQTCNANLKNTTVRTCPNPPKITCYLQEETNFEGEISEGEKVCLACYKFHLEILKEIAMISTDDDLEAVIASAQSSLLPITALNNMHDVLGAAMCDTIVYVGKHLLRQEALLLPSVYKFFSSTTKDITITANLEFDINTLPTARWVLSNLKTALQHHMSITCRVKKHGTILYRSNGDIMKSLSVSLHKSTNCTAYSHCSEASHTSAPNVEHVAVAQDINTMMQQQIHGYISKDAVMPYRFDQMDIDKHISDLDPNLWEFITLLTSSLSERRGKSKASTDPSTHTYTVKKVRHFFCLCVLMYCIDDRCYLPLHNLITDVVDSYGGSSTLIKILNRLGCVLPLTLFKGLFSTG